jgi:hypothetical protein
MLRFSTEAHGEVGTHAVHQWAAFNDTYFGGELRPIPLIITHTQPFGKRLGFCMHSHHHGHGRSITLNVPDRQYTGRSYALLADNCCLLHEMIHQHLQERGENAKHAGAPWCREIMRLHQVITGAEIWAGRTKTVRQGSKVVRINEPHEDGRASLPQTAIARWPMDTGISFGRLGGVEMPRRPAASVKPMLVVPVLTGLEPALEKALAKARIKNRRIEGRKRKAMVAKRKARATAEAAE